MQHKADGYIPVCAEPYGQCAMTSSEQATYLSLPRKRESSIIALLLLSPQSLADFAGAPGERAIYTRPQSKRGSLRAMTHGQGQRYSRIERPQSIVRRTHQHGPG